MSGCGIPRRMLERVWSEAGEGEGTSIRPTTMERLGIWMIDLVGLLDRQ